MTSLREHYVQMDETMKETFNTTESYNAEFARVYPPESRERMMRDMLLDKYLAFPDLSPDIMGKVAEMKLEDFCCETCAAAVAKENSGCRRETLQFPRKNQPRKRKNPKKIRKTHSVKPLPRPKHLKHVNNHIIRRSNPASTDPSGRPKYSTRVPSEPIQAFDGMGSQVDPNLPHGFTIELYVDVSETNRRSPLAYQNHSRKFFMIYKINIKSHPHWMFLSGTFSKDKCEPFIFPIFNQIVRNKI